MTTGQLFLILIFIIIMTIIISIYRSCKEDDKIQIRVMDKENEALRKKIYNVEKEMKQIRKREDELISSIKELTEANVELSKRNNIGLNLG